MKETSKAYTLALAVLLTLSAYLLADTVDTVLGKSLSAAPKFTGPLAPGQQAVIPRRELSDYSSILERGLFGEGKAPASGGTAEESSSYTLIGTVEGEQFSGAVLQDTSNQQSFYRRDQKLPDGSRIIKVKRTSVTLRTAGGGTVELQIIDDTNIVNMASAGGGGGVKRLSPGKFVVDQREIAASTENLGQILTQARALPYMEEGKTVGFRISEIEPGSIYEKIGLVNGDVVQRVNSQDVNDPGKFFQMYQGLKDEKQISIDLMRNGQKQTLNYDVR